MNLCVDDDRSRRNLCRIEIPSGHCLIKSSCDKREDKCLEDEPFNDLNLERRIENEINALEFLATENKIPTPEIVQTCMTKTHRCIATKEVEGVWINNLEDKEDIRAACAEVFDLRQRIQSLTSHEAKSFDRDLCFSGKTCDFLYTSYIKGFTFSEEGHPLCHGDLHHSNILVDPISARVKGLIDWEFSGYSHSALDPPRFSLENEGWHLEGKDEHNAQVNELLSKVHQRVYYPASSNKI